MDAIIAAFTSEARGFCELMEANKADGHERFTILCLRSVLHLYDQALVLPLTELPKSASAPKRMGVEMWKSIRSKIEGKLSRDHYWKVVEPLDVEPPQVIVGSLSDDLADIWCELVAGLQALNTYTDEGEKQALWHWRLSFETHWSRHAAGAISALNALCFGEFAETEEP